MSEKKLLPCPFCGGEADSHMTIAENYMDRPDGQMLWFVECKNEDCCASSGVHDTVEEAIKAWNVRKPMERIVERLEECYDRKHEGYMISRDLIDLGKKYGLEEAIEIAKEEGGLND